MITKDLLGLKDLSANEIKNILQTAETMKLIIKQPSKKTPHLQGKTVVNLFYETAQERAFLLSLRPNT